MSSKAHDPKTLKIYKYLTKEEINSWKSLNVRDRQRIAQHVNNVRMSKDDPIKAAIIHFHQDAWYYSGRIKSSDINRIKKIKDPLIRWEKMRALIDSHLERKRKANKKLSTLKFKLNTPQRLAAARKYNAKRRLDVDFVEKNRIRSEQYRNNAKNKFNEKDLSISKSQIDIAIRSLKKRYSLNREDYNTLVYKSQNSNKKMMFKNVFNFLKKFQ